MLVHRLRRWPNISPTLGQRLVFLGYNLDLWSTVAKQNRPSRARERPPTHTGAKCTRTDPKLNGNSTQKINKSSLKLFALAKFVVAFIIFPFTLAFASSQVCFASVHIVIHTMSDMPASSWIVCYYSERLEHDHGEVTFISDVDETRPCMKAAATCWWIIYNAHSR